MALQNWTRKCRYMGIQIHPDYYLYNLLFADDQVIITEDTDDASYMLRKLVEEYKIWGLEINFNKTEYLTMGLEEKLTCNTEEITHVEYFKYLGSIIQKDATTNLEIQRRITDGKRIIGMLNSILWSKNILHRTKKLIYQAIFQSTTLYGAETWTISRQQANKLMVLEMDFWRRSARKSRKEKIRNNKIREIMQVDRNILEIVEERRLRWYGHVLRMSEERIPNKILNWKVEGKRRRGKPKECWIDGVKRSMERRGLNEEDAMDRDLWRQKIVMG